MLTPGTKIKYKTLESKGKGRKRVKIRSGEFIEFHNSLPDRLIIRRDDGRTVSVNRRDIVEVGS